MTAIKEPAKLPLQGGMLSKIIEASEYNFKRVFGFEVKEVDDCIWVEYYTPAHVFDFILVENNFEECLEFVENHFKAAIDAEKYNLELAFN